MEIIDSRPSVADINTEDTAWTLQVGDATRRSLIRYFRPRAIDVIMAFKPLNGQPTPDKIKDMEPIDALAWRMADSVIDRIQFSATDYWEADAGDSAAEVFSTYLEDTIKEVEGEYFQTDSLNLDLSVAYEMAFEIPIRIDGCDEPAPEGPAV
ncbi:MAG: hypothetical protein ACR2RE_28740 [Geminicoccaceae bacterium]